MERCTRPWGWYETLTEGEGYLVKRLWLEPGQRLSLQRHQHRLEHWYIAAGEGVVSLDGSQHHAQAGSSFDVPCSCCLLYTSPSPRDKRQSRMPSSA